MTGSVSLWSLRLLLGVSACFELTARPVCLWSSRLLLGVGACFVLVEASESLPTRTMGDVWFGTICESSVESVCRVNLIFPCRVYIDSNYHDSQI
jgi:hypothetical protein